MKFKAFSIVEPFDRFDLPRKFKYVFVLGHGFCKLYVYASFHSKIVSEEIVTRVSFEYEVLCFILNLYPCGTGKIKCFRVYIYPFSESFKHCPIK